VTVAYSAAQAATETRTAVRDTVGEVQILQQIGQVRTQLDALEKKIDALAPKAKQDQVVPPIAPEIPSADATSGQQLQNAP
jgi:hypothetical protein